MLRGVAPGALNCLKAFGKVFREHIPNETFAAVRFGLAIITHNSKEIVNIYVRVWDLCESKVRSMGPLYGPCRPLRGNSRDLSGYT